jgi:uncharacterized protein DUF1844
MSDQSNERSTEIPIPPADFSFLVSSLMFEAQVEMGLLHFGGEEDAPEPNMPRAKHSIDLLALLQDKTKGNLTLDEQRLLENGLTELRFRYVQAVDEMKRQPSADATNEAKTDDGPRIITADGGKGTKSA